MDKDLTYKEIGNLTRRLIIKAYPEIEKDNLIVLVSGAHEHGGPIQLMDKSTEYLYIIQSPTNCNYCNKKAGEIANCNKISIAECYEDADQHRSITRYLQVRCLDLTAEEIWRSK